MKKYKLRKGRAALLVTEICLILLVIFGIYKVIDRYVALNLFDINFKLNQIEIMENDSYTLEIDCSTNRFNDEIVWESSNTQIVEVEQGGNLIAHTSGKAEVKAFVKGASSIATCEVNVLKTVELEEISLTDSINHSLYVGANINLDTKLYPENTTQKNLEYSVSNENIAEVSKDGILKIKGVGKFVLTVLEKKSTKKVEKTIETIQNPTYIKNISFQFGDSLSLDIGEKYQLKPIFSPTNIDDQKLKYVSNNTSVAEVSVDGMIMSKNAGEAVITCISDYSKYEKKFKVIIRNNKGFITKEMLDASGAINAKKVMIVAHPDDETLWGGGHLLEGDWFVVCLTNGNNAIRSREFSNALLLSNSKHLILSYPDLKSKKIKDNWDYVKVGITKDIETILRYKNWNQIVTHNPNGEYGHIHHKMVNRFTSQISSKMNVHNKLYYFGKYYPLGQVPTNLAQNITGNTYANKLKMVDAFTTQRKAISNYWEQMLPYEHWIKADNW